MAYSDFTIQDVEEKLGIRLVEQGTLFADVAPIEPSSLLTGILRRNVQLALAIHTEKSRSELIVSPILVEVREALKHQVSLFSGNDFNVEPERGLNGVCDFLFCRSPEQQYIHAPAVVVIEAKNDNIKSGLGQCMAEMFAARIFNERTQTPARRIFGAVTTGTTWRFLILEGDVVFLDDNEHHISQLPILLGILNAAVRDGDSFPKLLPVNGQGKAST